MAFALSDSPKHIVSEPHLSQRYQNPHYNRSFQIPTNAKGRPTHGESLMEFSMVATTKAHQTLSSEGPREFHIILSYIKVTIKLATPRQLILADVKYSQGRDKKYSQDFWCLE